VRSLNHLSGFLGFWFAGSVIKRFGARTVLFRGTIAAGSIDIIAVTLAAIFTPFILAITNCVFGPCKSARSALLHMEFTDQQRATCDSMVSLSGSLLFAIISTLLGYVADQTSPGTAILAALVCSNLMVTSLYFKIFRIS